MRAFANGCTLEENPVGRNMLPPINSIICLPYRGWKVKIPTFDMYPYYETFIAGQYNSLRIEKGDRVLDAGAGIGDFSLLAADASGSAGQVISLEPDPYYYSILVDNLHTNRLKTCNPLRLAISDKTGSGWANLNLLESSKQIEASTVTPEDLLQKTGLSGFDVAKIDIEGAEASLFRDTSWLLGVHDLAVETHGPAFDEIVPALREAGFHVSIYNLKEMLTNALRFALSHPFDFARAEGASRALGIRTAMQTLLGTMQGPKIVSSTSPLRIILAKKPGNC